MSNTAAHPIPAFVQGRPFFEMVTSFLAATVGMGPVFDPKNPLNLSQQTIAGYRGKVRPDLLIDMGQVHQQCTSGALSPDAAVKNLCCMLLNSTYEIARPHNDNSPVFEVFRHLRNAASHRNRFHFLAHEPARAAQWQTLVIPQNPKGSSNPLSSVECVGATVLPADVLALLHEIEDRLP
jgi:hypothetical protein